MAKETLTTKLGKTRAGERSRIWIEGARLEASGFPVGTVFLKKWDAKARTLEISKRVTSHTPRTSKGTVTGKGEHPIIDVVGILVMQTFGEVGAYVRADYLQGRIVIKVVPDAECAK